ncbi:MAG: twin-arginine translocase TatA/TatE family subunit, partial [Thermoleophilia bacterium]|nr:twin-arginine translocase TatA/TatE family subunit [Thermoleophilia bacterium]
MPFDFSVGQILIVLVIALLVFGPRRLPEIARQLGKGIGEFKQSVSDVTHGPSSVASMSASAPAPPAAPEPAASGGPPPAA